VTRDLPIEPFRVEVGEDVLADLRARIRATRWPEPAPGPAWSQGTDFDYLRDVLAYWADRFDWRAQERALNQLAHFRARLGGIHVHFVHERARPQPAIPLILSHGWPSSFIELLSLVPYLTDPEGHGIDGPAFDVVIPSLPGYGFSERPARAGITYRYTAALWHRLMRGLGYERYGAQGGDFGAGVATYMALDDPGPMIGIYLTTPEIAPFISQSSRPLTEAERSYVERTKRWGDVERGYSSIQSTKPQTVGYGLTDSPAGLAAWILEKWRSWTDSGGDLDVRFSRDFLLTMLTIYWATRSIATSMRDYFDNRWYGDELGPDAAVRVPTSIAVFANHFVPEGEPPREWSERLYAVRRWTRMPRGGHFAPVEEPELLARDISAFFGELSAQPSFADR
jgi:pimeloyl-ACP methyl ester carboxylesterase